MLREACLRGLELIIMQEQGQTGFSYMSSMINQAHYVINVWVLPPVYQKLKNEGLWVWLSGRAHA
jgi:hypothetical protein